MPPSTTTPLSTKPTEPVQLYQTFVEVIADSTGFKGAPEDDEASKGDLKMVVEINRSG